MLIQRTVQRVVQKEGRTTTARTGETHEFRFPVGSLSTDKCSTRHKAGKGAHLKEHSSKPSEVRAGLSGSPGLCVPNDSARLCD